MSACSITLSNAVRNSSSRWSWKAMPTSVIGCVTRPAADEDLAAAALEQPGDHEHQRALAAARRPDDRDELAGARSSTLTSFSARNGLSVSSPNVLETRRMLIGTPDRVLRAFTVRAHPMRRAVGAPRPPPPRAEPWTRAAPSSLAGRRAPSWLTTSTSKVAIACVGFELAVAQLGDRVVHEDRVADEDRARRTASR